MLPDYDYSLVIRTDFSDDAAWQRICAEIEKPQTENQFRAMVECISDPTCAGLVPERVGSVLPSGSTRSFVFLVDALALSPPDRALLVVDVIGQVGRSFRVVPSAAWAVENNLRLANADFDDFLGACDKDGIFRGLPTPP